LTRITQQILRLRLQIRLALVELVCDGIGKW
jgi:hypothetical protein